jgi:hypothetical protein
MSNAVPVPLGDVKHGPRTIGRVSHEPGIPAEIASVASVEQRLRDIGASVSSWSNGPGDRYPAHEHGYDKVLVALAGSITFLLPMSEHQVELRSGDRLDLPAGTMHGAVVGHAGVRCLEGHLPAGRLGDGPRHVAGWAGGDAAADTAARMETVGPTGT